MEPQPRRDTDPWLVFTLSSHSEKLNGLTKEVKKINSSLRDEITNRKMEDVKHDERIDRQRERFDDHKKIVHGNPKPNNPGNKNGVVTFKWIADNAASIATGVITALLVAALVLWATGSFG
jgi:hypothetical protein